MGPFTLADEEWALFLSISDKFFSETRNFLTTNSSIQLVSESTDKDGILWDIILHNFDNPDRLFIEKHLGFSDCSWVFLGIPR